MITRGVNPGKTPHVSRHPSPRVLDMMLWSIQCPRDWPKAPRRSWTVDFRPGLMDFAVNHPIWENSEWPDDVSWCLKWKMIDTDASFGRLCLRDIPAKLLPVENRILSPLVQTMRPKQHIGDRDGEVWLVTKHDSKPGSSWRETQRHCNTIRLIDWLIR